MKELATQHEEVCMGELCGPCTSSQSPHLWPSPDQTHALLNVEGHYMYKCVCVCVRERERERLRDREREKERERERDNIIYYIIYVYID